MGWIGVDLDRTLAHYESGDYHKYGPEYIGAPIPLMISRVKGWLREGREVKIFTARDPQYFSAIERWTEEHLGQKLEVTNVKDHHMYEMWDDRAVQVIPNTGETLKDTHNYELSYIAQRIEDLDRRLETMINVLEYIKEAV